MSDVLVVDDEDSTCRLLAALLRRRGFSVACATRGADCLQILSSQTPRLVILDVMMPEMDGLSVLRSMRADQRLKTVPVVLYSALSDTSTRGTAERLGVQGYVVKGTGLEQLLPLIEQYLPAQE